MNGNWKQIVFLSDEYFSTLFCPALYFFPIKYLPKESLDFLSQSVTVNLTPCILISVKESVDFHLYDKV
jgi:hypothetical protein